MEQVKDCAIKKLVFDDNYIFDTPSYWNEYHLYNITNEEESDLLNTINSITFPSLQSGDSVYFEDDVIFPRNLCTTLGKGLKRTIKKDKATKILIRKDKSFYKDNYSDYLKFGYYIKFPDRDNLIFFITDSDLAEVNLSKEKAERLVKGSWNRGFVLKETISLSYFDLVKEYGSNLTPISELIKYINSSLPNLTESSKENILGLVTNNQEQLKLAFNTLIGFNTSDILWDFIFKLGKVEDIDPHLKNSVNFKYILSIFGYSFREYQTLSYSYYYDSVLQKISNIYHSDLISDDQKEKVWKYFDSKVASRVSDGPYKYSQKELDQFDKYNMPRPKTDD